MILWKVESIKFSLFGEENAETYAALLLRPPKSWVLFVQSYCQFKASIHSPPALTERIALNLYGLLEFGGGNPDVVSLIVCEEMRTAQDRGTYSTNQVEHDWRSGWLAVATWKLEDRNASRRCWNEIKMFITGSERSRIHSVLVSLKSIWAGEYPRLWNDEVDEDWERMREGDWSRWYIASHVLMPVL